MNEDVYYCCYVDDDGNERVSRFPYRVRSVAEAQVEWLTGVGYRHAHVRVAQTPTGEVLEAGVNIGQLAGEVC